MYEALSEELRSKVSEVQFERWYSQLGQVLDICEVDIEPNDIHVKIVILCKGLCACYTLQMSIWVWGETIHAVTMDPVNDIHYVDPEDPEGSYEGPKKHLNVMLEKDPETGDSVFTYELIRDIKKPKSGFGVTIHAFKPHRRKHMKWHYTVADGRKVAIVWTKQPHRKFEEEEPAADDDGAGDGGNDDEEKSEPDEPRENRLSRSTVGSNDGHVPHGRDTEDNKSHRDTLTQQSPLGHMKHVLSGAATAMMHALHLSPRGKNSAAQAPNIPTVAHNTSNSHPLSIFQNAFKKGSPQSRETRNTLLFEKGSPLRSILHSFRSSRSMSPKALNNTLRPVSFESMNL